MGRFLIGGLAGMVLLVAAPLAQAANSGMDCPASACNLTKGNLALGGYDPVSYFKGGPKMGEPGLHANYHGVTYHFASEADRTEFLKDPAKYVPAFGGWCAWGVLKGKKVDADPRNYMIVNGKNFVFYKGFLGNTRKRWTALAAKDGEQAQVKKAESSWKKIAGK